jgi:ribosomal protein S27AE
MARNANENVKSSWACPKCNSRDLIRVPGRKGGRGGVEVTAFALGNLQPSRYICGKCGFVEEYVDVPAHLERIRNKYAIVTRRAKTKR